MEEIDLNGTQNEIYCCTLCFEETIDQENGAKMCRDCQKPICNNCYRKLLKKQQYIHINFYFL